MVQFLPDFNGLRTGEDFGAINIGDQLRVLSEQDGMLYTRLLGTDVSFIFQQHPLLYETITYRGVDLASPIDIGLMKLAAIKTRAARAVIWRVVCPG